MKEWCTTARTHYRKETSLPISTGGSLYIEISHKFLLVKMFIVDMDTTSMSWERGDARKDEYVGDL